MLQKKKMVATEEFHGSTDCFHCVSPMKKIIQLIHQFSRDFQISPSLHVLKGEYSLRILFEYACFECDALLTEYGEIIASIAEDYPISLCGMLQNLEMGELTAKFSGGALHYEKSSPSGQDFTILSSVYVKINFKNDEELEFMQEILPRSAASGLAFPRKYMNFFKENEFWGIPECTHFLYLSLEDSGDVEETLPQILTVGELEELWLLFLRSGVTAVEFDRLYDRMNMNFSPFSLRLELSLQMALFTANFKVQNDRTGFAIFNAEGERMQYDFLSRSTAEKLFMKILFPVKSNF